LVLASSAIGLEVTALVLAAAAILSFGGSLVAAGALEVAANAAGVAAEDPPIPDFQYLVRVPIAPLPIPDTLPMTAELAALRSFLEIISRCTAAISALGPIESKLLGARIDANPVGTQLQVTSYREAVQLLDAASAALAEPGSDVASWLVGLERQHGLELQSALQSWKAHGLTPPVTQQWQALELNPDSLPRLSESIRRMALPLPAAADQISRVISSLLAVAAYARKRSETILSVVE
jgi:uncharacterized coiled-coil protein SlyX